MFLGEPDDVVLDCFYQLELLVQSQLDFLVGCGEVRCKPRETELMVRSQSGERRYDWRRITQHIDRIYGSLLT